jgi:hypothetical protein
MIIACAGAGGPIDEYRFGNASVVGAGEVGAAWAMPGSATPPNGILGFSFGAGGAGAEAEFGPSLMSSPPIPPAIPFAWSDAGSAERGSGTYCAKAAKGVLFVSRWKLALCEEGRGGYSPAE